MIVRELITRLGFRADQGAAQRYDRALGGVAVTARRVIAAVGVASAGIGAMVTRFAASSTETLNWARRLEISTRELQRLSAAAGAFGVNRDAMIDGLKELSLRTDEFIETAGGPALEAFQRLGFSVEDLRGLTNDTGELFRVVQERMSQIEDAGARQRIADELFGGTAAEQFTEFLQLSRQEIDRMGDEAERFGQVIPEETLRRAREFSRNFTILKGVIAGVGNVIAEDLLPVLEEVTARTRKWVLENRQVIRQNLGDFIQGTIAAIRKLLPFILEVNKSLGGTENTIKALVAAYGLIKFAAIVAGLAAIAAQGKLTGVALLGLQLKVALLGGAFLLLLDDIWAWQDGQESVMGELLGDWETFADDLVRILADAGERILRQIEAIKQGIRESLFGDILKGASIGLGEIAKLAPGGERNVGGLGMFPDMSPGLQPVAPGPGASQNIFNIDSNVTVPQGTTQEQADFLTGANQKAIRDALNEAIRESAGDFPRAE